MSSEIDPLTTAGPDEEKPHPVSITAMQMILDKLFAFGELEKPKEEVKSFPLQSYKDKWSQFVSKVSSKKEITP